MEKLKIIKEQKSNNTVKQNSEQQETPKQGAKPKERANTSINFTKQDVKDLFQKQKNAINQFFESKGIKENNKSIIRDKMLSGSKITEEQLIKALDDVEYYDIDKLNEIFAEEKDAVEEYFKDDKNVAKI